METKHDLQTLIARKLEGVITAEELNALEAMLATSVEADEEYRALEKIWNGSRHLGIPGGSSAAVRWQRLESQIEIPPARNPTMIWMRYAAVAAIFLIVAMVYFVMKDEWVTISTSENETISMTLPDSSVVKIQGGTRLSYNASDWKKIRRVRLQGEAHFQVKKNGNSFIVESPDARVAVLGTSFNVSSSAQHTVVTCFTGKVSVASKISETSVILTRGLETVVKGNVVSAPYMVSAPQDQLVESLDFNKAPLRIVFESLAKHYGKPIVVPRDIDAVSFTGNLEGTSLESALNTVCLSAGLKFTIAPDSVFIK